MSTKAIERALEILDGIPPYVDLPKDTDQAVSDALNELRAIREAAKTLERLGLAGLKCMTPENHREHSEAEVLLFRIAKED